MDTTRLFQLWMDIRNTQKEELKIHTLNHSTAPSDWEVTPAMKEALELDPEGFSAVLLLNSFRQDFFGSCGLSISDILSNPNYPAFIEKCKELETLLNDDAVTIPLQQFISSLTAAIREMDAEKSAVTEMFADKAYMGILRRDALRAMKELHFHQFFQGETATDHLKYQPDIHMFFNMNSLIQCAWNSEDGVSINLIKDAVDTSSYFAFVAKNGGNLSVLTDKPYSAHPLQKYMTRRPEKAFTSRVYRNHFPYGLLDLTVDYKGYLWPGRGGMVPLQTKPVKIGSVAEMEPDEVIWTIMMFSQIDAKLYKENYHCKELSYTSHMLEDPTAYDGLQGSSMLMVRDYKPLRAPILKMEDLEQDSQYTQHGFNEDRDGVFADTMWFYDRYKTNVPENVLNGLLPDEDKRLFLLPGNVSYIASGEEINRDFYGNETLIDPKKAWYEQRIKGAYQLHKMTGDEFGTAEELQADYRWYARYNAIQALTQQAQEEFDREHKALEEWVNARMKANLERIATDVVLWSDAKERGEDISHPGKISMASMQDFSREHGYWNFTSPYHVYARSKGNRWHQEHPLENLSLARCQFEDAPCCYLLKAFATTAEDLAYLTGCESVQDLPELLQHWRNGQYTNGDFRRYYGNPILARIDPLAWKFENPWLDLRFGLVIGVGKKFVSKIRKNNTEGR